MNKIMINKLIISLILILAGCASQKLEYTMKIPPECGNQISPSGDTESKRYTMAYEAFWWQCIKDKSENINIECRSTCNGTSCATYGCSEGGYDAEIQINEITKRYGQDHTQKYLKDLLKTEKYKEKTKNYFGE